MNILDMKPHPLALMLPKLAKHEDEALENSMKEGFDEGLPVVVWLDPSIGEDRILDGVNRRDKAKKLGITQIPVRRFDGDATEAARFVAYRQLGRRSPDPSQRAAIMAHFRKDLGLDLDEAAHVAGVSVSQMEKASALANKSPTHLTRVVRGELTVSRAVNKLKRTLPEASEDAATDPLQEINRTTDRLRGAIDALVKWAEDYLDPVLDRRGAEMLKANLSSRAKVVGGKKVLGLAMIEEMVQTIKRNMPKAPCPTCKGTGCSDCGDRRYITAHEVAMQKNHDRSQKARN